MAQPIFIFYYKYSNFMLFVFFLLFSFLEFFLALLLHFFLLLWVSIFFLLNSSRISHIQTECVFVWMFIRIAYEIPYGMCIKSVYMLKHIKTWFLPLNCFSYKFYFIIIASNKRMKKLPPNLSFFSIFVFIFSYFLFHSEEGL